MAYEFHYTPTGTGVISGKEVLEQTEDAINDLGNTAISGVQEALDKAEQALTNSENAVDDAQTALNTANNAEGVAIQAQTDVGNLSGTVTNIGNRVTTAEGNITNLQGRMTTAEGNITNIQGRMTTAETNIGNLQTAVSTAQATANSAQQTATTARQQSYVFRYSSTALTPSSTNANSLLDNTDNLKVGDKVIDSSGVLFSITAIDTANSTFTIGTALIDLAQDSDVVHKSGDEIVGGDKVWTGTNAFQQNIIYARTNFFHQAVSPCYILKDTELEKGSLASTHTAYPGLWQDKNNNILGYVRFVEYNSGRQTAEFRVSNLIKNGALDPTGSEVNCTLNLELQPSGEKSLIPERNNDINLGTATNKWKTLNGVEPGALSLPSGNANNVIDISSYISALDGTSNSYTVPANGWVSIAVVGTAIAIVSSSWSDSRLRASSGDVRMLYPVLKNETLDISVIGTTLAYARFIPCQGNI